MTDWNVAADFRASLGEGPVWDASESCLWFVDVDRPAIHRLDPTSGRVSTQDVAQTIGAAIPRVDGGLVLALADGVHLASWEQAQTTLAVPLGAPAGPTVRLNDAKCDPRGRLWAGTVPLNLRAGGSTLYRFGPEGAVPVVTGCALANGLGWSPRADRLYFIDSRARTIDAFDYAVADGEISERRTWLRVPEEAGWADGMTVDAEGGVWVAMYLGSAVHRYSADGILTEVVDLPTRKVTSVCFGGPDLTDLYVTSSSAGLTATELDEQPYAGCVFVVPAAGRGLPGARFDLATIDHHENWSRP